MILDSVKLTVFTITGLLEKFSWEHSGLWSWEADPDPDSVLSQYTCEECTEPFISNQVMDNCGYVLICLMGGEVLTEAEFLFHARLMNYRPS